MVVVVHVPERRPSDPAFLAMADALAGGAPRSRPPAMADEPSRSLLWNLVVALAVVVPFTIGVYTRVAAGSSPETRPCPAVGYRVEGLRAGTPTLGELDRALAELTAATGITFTPSGPGKRQDVTFSWVSREQFRQWADSPRWLAYAVTEADDDRTVLRGHVVFDLDAPLLVGHGPASWGAVIRHELGHLLGLDHSPVRGHLMYPRIDHGPGHWSAEEHVVLAELCERRGATTSR